MLFVEGTGFFSLLSDHNVMKLYIPGRYIPVLCVFCHMSKFLICLCVYVAYFESLKGWHILWDEARVSYQYIEIVNFDIKL